MRNVPRTEDGKRWDRGFGSIVPAVQAQIFRETVTEYIRKYLQNHYLPRNAVGLINPLEPEGKKNYKVMSFSGKRFRMQYHMMIQHLLKKKGIRCNNDKYRVCEASFPTAHESRVAYRTTEHLSPETRVVAFLLCV